MLLKLLLLAFFPKRMAPFAIVQSLKATVLLRLVNRLPALKMAALCLLVRAGISFVTEGTYLITKENTTEPPRSKVVRYQKLTPPLGPTLFFYCLVNEMPAFRCPWQYTPRPEATKESSKLPIKVFFLEQPPIHRTPYVNPYPWP